MHTNGHEWQKNYLTTKNTKDTKIRRGERKNHEWTRMAKELFNHEKHEKHENKKRGEEEPRMNTNEHEWQKNYLTTKSTKGTK